MRRNLLICCVLLLLPCVGAAQKGKQPPEAGAVFRVSATKPGWPTCDVEFRDAADVKWPNFFYGKPGGDGSFTFDPKGGKIDIVLKCDQMAQRKGDQSRRVLGELLADEKVPTVTLTLTGVDALVTEIVEEEKNGKKTTKRIEYAPVRARLDVGGHKADVQGKAILLWGYPKSGDKPDSVRVEVRFAVPPASLGLKDVRQPLACRAAFTAYTTPPTK